jgi:hypothetical protein
MEVRMKKTATATLALGDRVTGKDGLEGTVVGLGEFLFANPKALVFGKTDDAVRPSARWVETAELTVDDSDGRMSLVHGGYPTAVIAAS